MVKTEFVTEAHHLLGGDNSLDALAADITEFVRWEMTHSSKKKIHYDDKKFVLYYIWGYKDISEWFDKQHKVFHYPVFLIDAQSTINVKISIGRDVRSRRKMHDTPNLLATKGNEKGSHKTQKLEEPSQESAERWSDTHILYDTSKPKTDSYSHTIYMNTYRLAWEAGMDVAKYIKSKLFEQELAGTVKHEFMHAFDTYFIKGFERRHIDRMKKIYKKYRKDNNITKPTVTMSVFGKWNGRNFAVDKDYLFSENHLRDFFYMLPYYFAKTEMNAYLQTFSNQLSISQSISEYDCDIYKRYVAIKRILQTSVPDEIANKLFDKKFISDFTLMFQKLKKPLLSNNKYDGVSSYFITELDKYLHKMHKILFDYRQMQ